MKLVSEMNTEELVLAFQSATRAEWTKGIIETANELSARLRERDAAKEMVDSRDDCNGICEGIRAAMLSARSSGTGGEGK